MNHFLEKIRLLGDPVLREVSQPVKQEEVALLGENLEEMWSLVSAFRSKYGRGRAIAAPQIGLLKRIICLDTGGEKQVFFNPELKPEGDETMELWDDCMSFPNLLVRVRRYRKVTLSFRNTDWEEQTLVLEGDMAELLQHEYDHLEGILAIDRALNNRSLRWIPGSVAYDYLKEFDAAVTVCDRQGTVLYMNERSVQQFAGDGGRSLLGKNLLECHPEPARSLLKEMLETGKRHVYTSEKNGKKKLICQAPWIAENKFQGIIEIGLDLPSGMPHHVRDDS
jgi:peptide deformylase